MKCVGHLLNPVNVTCWGLILIFYVMCICSFVCFKSWEALSWQKQKLLFRRINPKWTVFSITTLHNSFRISTILTTRHVRSTGTAVKLKYHTRISYSNKGWSLTVHALFSFGIVLWEIATRDVPFKGVYYQNYQYNYCICPKYYLNVN